MWPVDMLRLPRGVHYTKHVRVYVSAQKGYSFELGHTTYTYATQIVTRSYVHIWGTFKKYTTFVRVW